MTNLERQKSDYYLDLCRFSVVISIQTPILGFDQKNIVNLKVKNNDIESLLGLITENSHNVDPFSFVYTELGKTTENIVDKYFTCIHNSFHFLLVQ